MKAKECLPILLPGFSCQSDLRRFLGALDNRNRSAVERQKYENHILRRLATVGWPVRSHLAVPEPPPRRHF